MGAYFFAGRCIFGAVKPELFESGVNSRLVESASAVVTLVGHVRHDSLRFLSREDREAISRIVRPRHRTIAPGIQNCLPARAAPKGLRRHRHLHGDICKTMP